MGRMKEKVDNDFTWETRISCFLKTDIINYEDEISLHWFMSISKYLC